MFDLTVNLSHRFSRENACASVRDDLKCLPVRKTGCEVNQQNDDGLGGSSRQRGES